MGRDIEYPLEFRSCKDESGWEIWSFALLKMRDKGDIEYQLERAFIFVFCVIADGRELKPGRINSHRAQG